MGIVVDLIIIAIMLLSIFLGYKRGLIKCAVNVLSFFIAILVVIILTTPISNLIINNTKIDDNIKATIVENLDFDDVEKIELDKENSNAPEIVIEYINNMMKETANDATANLRDVLAENIAKMIINITVAIILFFGTKLALVFVKVLADIVGKIPLIKQFNEVGGVIYGIASGIIKIYLILAVISIIVPLLADSSLAQAINSSVIGKVMYDNNLLLKIIL